MCVILAAAGCVDPISFADAGSAGSLVVDGWITDRQGPLTIKLSRSINFDNSRTLRVYPIPEGHATVVVSDDKGLSIPLPEVETGTYRVDNFHGVVGNTYTLHIQTSDGNRYTSSGEKMLPVQAIDQLEYEFRFYDLLFINAAGNARVIPMDAFYIYAKVKDPAETGNYYRWISDGIFEFFSVTDNPAIKQCWAAKDRLESKLELKDDTFINGQEFRQLVCIIPYDRPTQYLVNIYQQSLTEDAHQFWKMSAAQQVSAGSLFDPPPSPVRGNIVNTADPEETVLGYFGASAMVQQSMLLERFKFANSVSPSRAIPLRPGDCRTHELGATNVKPAGFK